MNVKLSVIVPVYNVQNYLRRCIDSIISQSFTNFELILVDDGSTDSSTEICDEYEKTDQRIKVVHKSNGGLSSARNFGIDVAEGDYISFIDSDDWIEPTMFQDMLSCLESTHADICICGLRTVLENGEIEEEVKYNSSCTLSGSQATKILLLDKEIPSFAWNKIYKRALWHTIRFPIGRYYEDTAIIYKVFTLAQLISITDQVYYNYFRCPNSICLNPDLGKELKRRNDNFLAFFERYMFTVEKQFNDILDICALKSISLGLSLIHFHLQHPDIHYDNQLPIGNIVRMINKIRSTNLSSLNHIRRLEYYIIRTFPLTYTKFISLIILIKK